MRLGEGVWNYPEKVDPRLMRMLTNSQTGLASNIQLKNEFVSNCTLLQ